MLLHCFFLFCCCFIIFFNEAHLRRSLIQITREPGWRISNPRTGFFVCVCVVCHCVYVSLRVCVRAERKRNRKKLLLDSFLLLPCGVKKNYTIIFVLILICISELRWVFMFICIFLCSVLWNSASLNQSQQFHLNQSEQCQRESWQRLHLGSLFLCCQLTQFGNETPCLVVRFLWLLRRPDALRSALRMMMRRKLLRRPDALRTALRMMMRRKLIVKMSFLRNSARLSHSIGH